MSDCICEYVDVGVGLMLAEPIPGCPEHPMEVLTALTYRRHTMERSVGVEPVQTHWGHQGCPCGCGDVA